MTMPPINDPATDLVFADGALVASSEIREVRSRSYMGLVWRRFRRHRLGLVGAVLVALIMLTAIFASVLAPYDPYQRDGKSIYLPPQRLHVFADDGFHPLPFTNPVKLDLDPDTYELVPTIDTATRCSVSVFGKGWTYSFFGIRTDRHLFAPAPDCGWHVLGTDRDGRDMLSRLLIGSRLTLLMAAVVVTISVIIGTLVGMVSGYFRGAVDHWLQRIVEFILALPELPFYFALVVIIPRNADPFRVFLALVGILSVMKWAQLAREVRGKTLSVASLDYIVAAEAVGTRTPRIVLRHILPNVLSHVVVATTLMIPSIVLLESFLSFLGIGVRAPLVSWGLLLNAASDLQNLGSYPWVLTPVVAILITVMGFNMLGDGLRDAIDPYQN
ncbi:peptide/nickel transport system permease protein [Faunimonas pinastri]|uniref:Peptide/nickel transport system permease protein n=1 Tax=Faunimonas pinastri TaxID=1855383 RepID=A0A1H9K5N3_9HYPH|nr:ABC transporter permease [Faunimonas pinastri]SEQ94253.1 peptide/nickel transport system permease protein [Faunimonas pinastri]